MHENRVDGQGEPGEVGHQLSCDGGAPQKRTLVRRGVPVLYRDRQERETVFPALLAAGGNRLWELALGYDTIWTNWVLF